jgi:hypothetical protein
MQNGARVGFYLTGQKLLNPKEDWYWHFMPYFLSWDACDKFTRDPVRFQLRGTEPLTYNVRPTVGLH